MPKEEFKGNSYKSKDKQSEPEQEKKVKKVVQGKVSTKKKSGVRKLADIFLAEDIANVKNYVIFDVLVPYAKNAAEDAFRALLYGRDSKKNTSSRTRASKISYQNYYDEIDGRNRDRSSRNERTSSEYDYDEIILGNRGEAEDVLDRMDEIVSTYGTVSVADLYDLVGITGKYTDNKYGWTNVHNATVVRVREGYLLKLPKVLPLDN